MEANGEVSPGEGSSPKPRDPFRRRGASEDLPEWLPDGWIMEIRRRKDGRADKYFMSPVSGRTFRSGAAVMHYLNFGKDGCLTPQEAAYFDEDSHGNRSPNEVGDSSPQRVTWFEGNNDGLMDRHGIQVEDNALAIQLQSNGYNIVSKDMHQLDAEALLGWIPEGWFIEIRIRKNERKGRRRYKCYFDPTTRSRFYSKEDVLHYLQTGEACNYTYEWEMDESDMILSQIEYTPKGFPAGWIKELKIRLNASGIRKDPYYSDPVSGYVFRTKKDVFHFLATGELSKYATKPKGAKIINKLNKTREATPPAIARSVAVQPPENEQAKCLLAPQLPSSVDKTIDGDASIENSMHLLLPCEVAGLELSSMTRMNHQKDNTVPAENSNNPCTEVKHVNLPSVSPKSFLSEADLLHKGSVDATCPANGKLSELPKQKQSTPADEFSVDVNGTTGPNAPRQSTVLVKMDLRQEKIRTLKAAARKLPELSKAKAPSNQHPCKPTFQEAVRQQITSEKQIPTDDKLSKVPNEKPLESKHVQFPRLEKESSNKSNQWEFLATTANNLANPMPFRLPLARQPRMYKKLAIRKPAYKTVVFGEKKGTVSNVCSTSMLAKPANVYPAVMAPKVPPMTAELSSALEQINTLPADAVQNTFEPSKEKPHLEKLPIRTAGIPSLSAGRNRLRPGTEMMHQPVKSTDVLSADTVSKTCYKSTEVTSGQPSKILHESADMGSHESAAGKLPSPMMAVDTYSDDKLPCILHKSAEKMASEHVEGHSPLNLVVVIAPPPDIASKSIPELGNENLLEPTKEDLLQSSWLEGILPAEIQQKECKLTEKLQNDPENESLSLSVKPHMPEECETTEENLSKPIKGDFPSDVVPSTPMENPADPLPAIAIETFPSEIVPESAADSLAGQAKGKLSPSRQNNVSLAEDRPLPLEFSNDPTNAAFAQTVPGASCESKNKNTHKQANETTQKTASDFASHPETLPQMLPHKAARDNILQPLNLDDSRPIGMLLETPSRSNKNQPKLEREKSSSKGDHSRKPVDGKPRKLRITSLIDEANIIQVPRRSRSPLTRSKSKVPRRTSPRLAGSQPVKPIITYKRKRRRTT